MSDLPKNPRPWKFMKAVDIETLAKEQPTVLTPPRRTRQSLGAQPKGVPPGTGSRRRASKDGHAPTAHDEDTGELPPRTKP
jgi:hypothetical protein